MNHTRESEVNRAPDGSGRGRADAGGGRARAVRRVGGRRRAPGRGAGGPGRAGRSGRTGRGPGDRPGGGGGGRAGAGRGRGAARRRTAGIGEAGRNGGKAGTGRRRPRGPRLRAGTTGSAPRLSGPPRRSARTLRPRGKSLRPAAAGWPPRRSAGGSPRPSATGGASLGTPRGGGGGGGRIAGRALFRRPEGRRGRSADDPLCDRGSTVPDAPAGSRRDAAARSFAARERRPPPLFDRPFSGGGRRPGWPEVGWRRVRENAPGRFRPGAIRAGEPRSGRGNRRLNSPHRRGRSELAPPC